LSPTGTVERQLNLNYKAIEISALASFMHADKLNNHSIGTLLY